MIIDFKKYSSVKIGGEFEVEVLEQIREFDGFLIGGANNLLISPKPKNIGILSDNFNFIEILEQNKDFLHLRIGCKTKASQMYRFS
ncbi:UDP-N-acetylmuramate dehydrogenase, partial [Campylobacter coli]|nr:UDP-N-acetylmuramate dehydrogenase [Campylobacter coli]